MSERDEFDNWCYERIKSGRGYDMFDVWKGARATPPQTVPALTDEQMKTLLKENGVEIWATQVDDAGPVMLTWGTLKRIISKSAFPQPKGNGK